MKSSYLYSLNTYLQSESEAFPIIKKLVCSTATVHTMQQSNSKEKQSAAATLWPRSDITAGLKTGHTLSYCRASCDQAEGSRFFHKLPKSSQGLRRLQRTLGLCVSSFNGTTTYGCMWCMNAGTSPHRHLSDAVWQTPASLAAWSSGCSISLPPAADTQTKNMIFNRDDRTDPSSVKPRFKPYKSCVYTVSEIWF